MTKDQALKMALEALEEVVKWYQLRDKYDKPMPPHNQNPAIKQAIEAITAIKEALAQTQEPVAHNVIAGVLFDFMGWLTSRPKRIMLSSVDDASPAVDAIRDFAKMRSLSLDDAKVQDWQEALAQSKQEPVAVKHMMEWVDYLKRKSDYGQHMRIPSEMSAGACWELAIELEQFINTTPPQRPWVGLDNDDLIWIYSNSDSKGQAISNTEAKLKEKNG